MKKTIIVLFIATLLLTSNSNKKYIIPEEAIRFRIIANSNNIEDQVIKTAIKKELEDSVIVLLNNATSKEDAQNIIDHNIWNIDNIIKKYNIPYQINYGINYFPEKEYRNVTYRAGNYESLVITLGNGLGDNWWCVLYPPLCLIDEQNMSNSEYELYISKILKSFKS